MILVTSFGHKPQAWRDELISKTRKIMSFQWQEWPLKKTPSSRPVELLLEEKKFLSKYKNFVLLDQNGKTFSDESFFKFCRGSESRHFVIGPACGFHPDFYEQASSCLSLSSFTLTHELAQVLFAEVCYRVAAKSINHPFVK